MSLNYHTDLKEAIARWLKYHPGSSLRSFAARFGIPREIVRRAALGGGVRMEMANRIRRACDRA